MKPSLLRLTQGFNSSRTRLMPNPAPRLLWGTLSTVHDLTIPLPDEVELNNHSCDNLNQEYLPLI
jgi:hypothetical protein